jgi:hypothetical protein
MKSYLKEVISDGGGQSGVGGEIHRYGPEGRPDYHVQETWIRVGCTALSAETCPFSVPATTNCYADTDALYYVLTEDFGYLLHIIRCGKGVYKSRIERGEV